MATLESGSSQVRALTNAVSAAFVRANLPPEVLASPRITFTDMPWQRPPLQTEASLGGEDLQQMLNCRLNVTPEGLTQFWSKTLKDLYHTPSSTIRKGAFAEAKRLCMTNRHGSRLFAFSTPYGYPAAMEGITGVMLSLEVAKVAENSLPIIDIQSDKSNYLVTLLNGTVLGVRDGLPAIDSPWTEPSTGCVEELLTCSRGEVTSLCAYDSLALARSLAFEHRAEFKSDYAGVEQAISALRYLTTGRHCPELVRALTELPSESRRGKLQKKLVLECLDVMSTSATDRDKLKTLHYLLVPEAMSATMFKSKIYYGNPYPVFIAAKQLDKINLFLSTRLRELGGADAK